MWPTDADDLMARQRELASATPPPWPEPGSGFRLGACWVCFPRGLTGPGAAGDPAWSAAVLMSGGRLVDVRVRRGAAGAAYVPGLLALRIGALLEDAVGSLDQPPDVLLVDGTGRDHPRRAGLALHLGAELGLPTVGVTHRPLVATGEWPADHRGSTSPLRIGAAEVARWLRTRPGTRPLVVHAGWRVDLDAAVDLVIGAAPERRTPEPLRQARHAARVARDRS
jgi:deoxyribonuclease V